MADPQSSRGGQSDVPATVAGEELRASHADRDQVVDLLRVAAGDGRLSPEELDDRLERALTARTCAELAALTDDLPATPGAAVVPPGAGAVGATPKDLARIHVHGSSVSRDGRWVVPKELDVKVRARPAPLRTQHWSSAAWRCLWAMTATGPGAYGDRCPPIGAYPEYRSRTKMLIPFLL
jgi:hypothetical protein